MTFDVVLAGLGRIGCGYDLRQPDADRPATHMGALMADPCFRVLAAADPDPESRQACGERWPGPEYSGDAVEIIGTLKPDVVCVATPASDRTAIIRAAIEAEARFIFCEKPLASSLAEAEHIASIVQQSETELVVNFSRRWEPGCQETAGQIKNGAIGEINLVRGLYSGGVSNNGAHFLDLLRWWFGEIDQPVLGEIRDAATADFSLTCGDGIPVEVRGMDRHAYDLFRLEAFGSNGTILLDNFGDRVSVRKSAPLPADPSLRVLGPTQELATDPSAAMTAAWNNIYESLSGKASPLCSIEDGLAVARVCDTLERAMRQ